MTRLCPVHFTHGQSLPEFTLLCAMLAVALFVPYLDGQSVVEILWQAMVASFRSQSFLIAII
jgi:hypothetical protein